MHQRPQRNSGRSASPPQGATSTDPHATGTHAWQGVSWPQSAVTFTFEHGRATWTGGSCTVLVYVLRLTGTIACGRLWRLLPTRRGQGIAAPGQD